MQNKLPKKNKNKKWKIKHAKDSKGTIDKIDNFKMDFV